ncbi:MAG: hypothetical protein HY363_01535 [Candidatus Aenigmarchaeota archaeon]|nr:hypothetical protein [Candidatus Aenigmarchaeota archaeon]
MGWKYTSQLVVLFLLVVPFSTAINLNQYPAPFVVDGMLASNFAIVVGDEAAATDVAGAIDVSMQLQRLLQQSQAQKEAELEAERAQRKTIAAEAGTVSMSSTSDLLELDESLGSVREALTEADLDILKGGQIQTGKGRTEYNQYFRFSQTVGKVVFGEDEKDKIGDYLSWDDGDHLFTWELEFEQGLESELSGNDLEDLEDEDIFILGSPYVIANTDFQESTGRLRLTLLGGGVSTYLSENEKEIFTIDGKDYLVEVVIISENSDSIKLRVNGQLTPEMRRGETEVIDGVQLGIQEITGTAKEGQKSIVQFTMGAQKLELEDRNALDNNPSTASVRVNGEVIEDSDLKINAVVKVSGNRVAVNRITYRLFADAVLGDIFIPSGTGLREQLEEPEGMLSPFWNIVYNGLTQVKTAPVVYKPSGDKEYDLQFANQEGITYRFPLVTNEDGDGKLKYGDDDDDLWFIESNSDTTFYGTRGDYFVLSNCAGDDNTCFTHILKYSSADTSASNTITLGFDDLGTGRKDVILSNDTNSFSGELVVGGVSYKIFADTVFNSPPNISIDLNGDGSVSGDEAVIGIQGEGMIDLGSVNTNTPNTEGVQAIINGNADTTLTTLKKEFDDASANEVIAITIEPRSNNHAGITSLSATSGTLFGPFKHGETERAMSKYGIAFDFKNPSGDSAEKLTIDYPFSQRGADVRIITKTSPILILEPEKEEIAQTTGIVARLASEINNILNYNAILVGGPCANKHAAFLMGNPSPCWETVPLGGAIIQSIVHPNNNHAMIIAGREAKDTRKATTAIARGFLSGVPSDKAFVYGNGEIKVRIG